MKKYYIKTVSSPDEVLSAEKLYIDSFRNGTSEYEPRTSAALVYVRGSGIVCRMECEEKSPKAVITERDGDTYKDSCMEFFINCAPDKGDYYLNLEGNSIGTLHCKYGKDRYERKALPSEVVFPTATACITDSSWSVEYFLPLETIYSVFGVNDFHTGDVIRANFYKCGDETEFPHYGMWSPVTQEKLDFHTPEFFGELIFT